MKGNYLYLRKAQKIFKPNKRMVIRLKSHTTNIFNSSYMASFIEKKAFPNYELYIHKEYFSLDNLGIQNFETVRIPIDDKLWLELYFCFDFVSFVDDEK